MSPSLHGTEAMSSSPLSIQVHFRSLKDPRRKHRQRHRLLDIIVIALCAVIANANTWQEVEEFLPGTSSRKPCNREPCVRLRPQRTH